MLSFVICTPHYENWNGGSLFMHRLAARLQELGHRVRLNRLPNFDKPRKIRALKNKLFDPALRLAPGAEFEIVGPGQTVEDDDIVVYPELVRENYLGARNVVRWLLNKPNLLFPFFPIPGEMYFKAGDFSDDPAITGGGVALLTAWSINPIYTNEGSNDRQGTCYMIRKGKDRDIVHDLEDSICLDGKSHEEVAAAFNRAHTFYCYDEMTLYSQYAALCGCTSVVIPKYFDSHEAYVATRRVARYGVSYGFDHLEHAKKTQHLVAGLLEEIQRESDESIDRFVDLARARFSRMKEPS